MLPKRKAILFKACVKVLHKLEAHRPQEPDDKIRLTPQEIRDINGAYNLLFDSIPRIHSSAHFTQLKEYRAMNAAHPKNEYRKDSLIRDVAETCVTLRRLANGEGRSVAAKLADAALFCTQFYYELLEE